MIPFIFLTVFSRKVIQDSTHRNIGSSILVHHPTFSVIRQAHYYSECRWKYRWQTNLEGLVLLCGLPKSLRWRDFERLLYFRALFWSTEPL